MSRPADQQGREDEARRIETLLSLDILDTPPEPEFDDVVRIATILCDVPVALVSLVETDRQWFKARVGFDPCETPIGQSVCSYAMREDELLVIPDLTADTRTRANTLVTGEPHIRFYAGAVLRTKSGVSLGALCVIDDKPRPQGLTTDQATALVALARQTMALIEMRKAVAHRDDVLEQERHNRVAIRTHVQEVEDARAKLMMEGTRLRLAQDAGRVGTFEIDVASDTIFPSSAFCRIFGLPHIPSLASSVIEALTVATDRSQQSSRQSRANGSAALNVEYRIRRSNDGAFRWIARRAEFDVDRDGNPIRMFGTVQDVTDRKQRESRQVALVALGDELRGGTTSRSEVIEATARTLAETLNVSRCGFAKVENGGSPLIVECDWTLPGLSSLRGQNRTSAFPTTMRRLAQGETLAIPNTVSASWLGDDIKGYDAIGVKAQIQVPLMKNDVLLGVLFIDSGTARTWTPEEIQFVYAVSDRQHAELARLDAEAEQRLLNEELGHRLKNTFAMVLAIARQTLREVTERDAVESFTDRVMALSRAHDVLLQQSWGRANIRSIIEAVLNLQGDGTRFRLDGPDIVLGPKAVLSLSLLLHELATNANKYGALSSPTGRIIIDWSVSDPPSSTFRLTWREEGGPDVAMPQRKGVGSRLISMGLVGARRVNLQYEKTGLRADFEAQLSDLLESDSWN